MPQTQMCIQQICITSASFVRIKEVFNFYKEGANEELAIYIRTPSAISNENKTIGTMPKTLKCLRNHKRHDYDR